MPNFDALRAAIIGPMEYLCRPKPVTPCFLFQLTANLNSQAGNGTATNSSGNVRYLTVGRSWPQLYMINNTQYGVPVLTCTTANTVGNEWSLEFFCNWPDGDSSQIGIEFAGFQFIRTGSVCISFTFGGSSITPDPHTYSIVSHNAFVYDNGVLRYFENGTLVDSRALSLTDNPQSLTISNYTSNKGALISNLRLVPKALGTSSEYPVPSSLYTGYEVL